MNKLWTIIKKYIFVLIALVVCIVSFALNGNTKCARALAPINDFYATTVGWLASLIPFSLYGTIIVLAIPLLVLCIILIAKSKARLKTISVILGIILIVLAIFPISFGFSYSSPSVYKKLDLTLPSQSDQEQLCDALDICIAKINALCQEIEFSDGHSVNPLTFRQTADIICQSYTADKWEALPSFSPTPKQFFPSAFMNYFGITGTYFFLFSEPNVCGNLPDKDMPLTMAHEIAHAKGITKEGEANFVALLICVNATHPYVRYSGYCYAVTSLLNALYSQDKDLYTQKRSEVNQSVFTDRAHALAHYAQFDTWVADVGDKINDAYLKSNKVTDGVKSYSTAVKGILAYYIKYGDI